MITRLFLGFVVCALSASLALAGPRRSRMSTLIHYGAPVTANALTPQCVKQLIINPKPGSKVDPRAPTMEMSPLVPIPARKRLGGDGTAKVIRFAQQYKAPDAEVEAALQSLSFALSYYRFNFPTPALSGKKKAAAIEDLNSASTKLSRLTRYQDNAEARDLLALAKTRLEILRGDDVTRVIDGRTYNTESARALEFTKIEIEQGFVIPESFTRPLEHTDHIPFAVSENVGGHEGDVSFIGQPGDPLTGAESSMFFPTPSQYRFEGVDKPYDVLSEMPFKIMLLAKVAGLEHLPEHEIRRIVGAHRILTAMEPGESATSLAEGGMSNVFVTHPHRARWDFTRKGLTERALLQRYRLLKAITNDAFAGPLARRHVAVEHLMLQAQKRAFMGDQPLMIVLKNSTPSTIIWGVFENVFAEGATAQEIAIELSRYYDPKTPDGERAEIREWIWDKCEQTPDQMAEWVGALGQLYRDVYWPVVNLGEANGLQYIGNLSRGGIPTLQGADANLGQNAKFLKRGYKNYFKRGWGIFDF